MMINLDQGVTRLEYSVTYPYPASAVFAAITDFPAYPWWQPDVVGIRAAGARPAGGAAGVPARTDRRRRLPPRLPPATRRRPQDGPAPREDPAQQPGQAVLRGPRRDCRRPARRDSRLTNQ